MIKNISETRRIYERAYQMLRLKGESWFSEIAHGQPDEAQECAILSYDYHDSEFTGWINRQRFQCFKQGAEGYINSVWWKPF